MSTAILHTKKGTYNGLVVPGTPSKLFFYDIAMISKSRNDWWKSENKGAERAYARSAPLFSDILSTFVRHFADR